MNTVIQKNALKNGYYYSGFMIQNYCVISNKQPKIVGRWDSIQNCFWFWEFEGNRKIRSKLLYLRDLNNEIEHGFLPIKEIIPKEEFVIE